MSRAFASGKYAHGFCDVCGQRYELHELKPLSSRNRITNIKACPECWNPSHPQKKLGETPVDDPQALREPRPDISLDASRELVGSWEVTLDKLKVG